MRTAQWRVLADPRARLLRSTLAWPRKGDVLVGRLVRSERHDREQVLQYDFGGRIPLQVKEPVPTADAVDESRTAEGGAAK